MLLDFFVQCFTPSYYSYLLLKGLINCLCAPSTVMIACVFLSSRLRLSRNFCFLCIGGEKSTVIHIFLLLPSEKLLERNSGGKKKKSEENPQEIAGIKLKKTVSFITEPSWEIASILYFCVAVCCFILSDSDLSGRMFIFSQANTAPIYNWADKSLLFVVINQSWL